MSWADHAWQIQDVLAEFMGSVEEWQSTIEGTPSMQEMTGLNQIYHDYTIRLDTLYGYNKKASEVRK